MRCPTCGETSHPGYVTLRDTDIGDGLVRRSLVPCPDCGGSALVSGEDGATGTGRDVISPADQIIPVVPDPQARRSA